MKKSIKQEQLEKKILLKLSGKTLEVVKYIFNDEEIQILQDYANVVSIKRLGFNDHGPVHMRTAALNALKMFELLAFAEIKFNLEKESLGTLEDSKIVVLIATLLHDLGMTVARNKHEFLSVDIALPIINRILKVFYRNNLKKQVILRSMIIEGIFGHMATQTIHSLEAGLVLVGDGCDMEKGRARITTLLSTKPQVGDIHKYSSRAILKVNIIKGDRKPIKILVDMSQSVGFFQIEEVLYPKIASSPVKKYIELYAGVEGKDVLRYL
ncbi:MAG: phosphohydrolase [Candidatus Cloacimonetes bacterium]|nr:phosphohydrolase [Candidatus Cloacimonadota bacterium]